MHTPGLIQVSTNCWKHTDKYSVFYTKTSDPESDLHREDGPAAEYANGNKEWYINGNLIDVGSQEEFLKYLKTHKSS